MDKEMSRIIDELLKMKQRKESAGRAPQTIYLDPTPEDLDKLKQVLQDEVNSYEDEQIKVFLEYPEEIRELFLQVKREALLQEMQQRMKSIYRPEPAIIEQMRKRFHPNAIVKAEQEFKFRHNTTSLVERYKHFESAHNDKIANHILLDDKDEK